MTMIHHKRTAEPKQELPYTMINQNGGWENWEVVVLQHYSECQNIIQSNKRVKEWQTKLASQKSTESPPISTESPPISTDSSQKKHTCQYCSNSYSRSDSLKRHINRCKKKPNDEIYENRLEKLEQIIEQLMEQNKQLLEKDKSKSKITMINNGIINNNTYKLELGNENILEKLSEKQKKEILNKMHGSLLHYIQKIHFSGEYPECMNVVLTNLRSKYAYKYIETENKFIAMVANDVFDNLIDIRLEEICGMFDETRSTLKSKTEERMGVFIDGMKNNPDKKKQAVDDVKLMAYNNKDKIESQITI
jgi:hypothetical protein